MFHSSLFDSLLQALINWEISIFSRPILRVNSAIYKLVQLSDNCFQKLRWACATRKIILSPGPVMQANLWPGFGMNNYHGLLSPTTSALLFHIPQTHQNTKIWMWCTVYSSNILTEETSYMSLLLMWMINQEGGIGWARSIPPLQSMTTS